MFRMECTVVDSRYIVCVLYPLHYCYTLFLNFGGLANMPVELPDLLRHLNETLEPDKFKDYCPNGLQVEGRPLIARLATGVTASQALIEQAADWQADAILVHHGLFWHGDGMEIVGMKRRRIGTLLANDINLLAYHLPLDAHPELGNNAGLGRLLGVSSASSLDPSVGDTLVNIGSLPEAVSVSEIESLLQRELRHSPLYIGSGREKKVQKIAWCTGAAQGYIESAVAAGADLYITGEVSEQTVHVAREEGIHFLAAGHHATERFGAQSLGSHLAEVFDLQHRFFDIDNPV
ncbi:MAG: dinuclear metal center YbgI/SA1388 family protein [Halioglobus sp.]|jgi:dinuclear metal center YbgI/SA1388 family protein